MGSNYFSGEKSPLIRQCFWLFHEDPSENSRGALRGMKDAAANQVIKGPRGSRRSTTVGQFSSWVSRPCKVTNAVYWECYLSGLDALIYHVKCDFNIRLQSYTKPPPTAGYKILWKCSRCKRVQRTHQSMNKALLMDNTQLMQHARMSLKAIDIHTWGTEK